MLALALTLHLAAIDASAASLVPDTHVRLVQIDNELKKLKSVWPSGATVMTATGFGGAVLITGLGLVIGIAVGTFAGLGIFVIAVGIAVIGVLVGIAGLIWGGVGSGINARKKQALEEERANLLKNEVDVPTPEQLPPPSGAWPQVLNEPRPRPLTIAQF